MYLLDPCQAPPSAPFYLFSRNNSMGCWEIAELWSHRSTDVLRLEKCAKVRPSGRYFFFLLPLVFSHSVDSGFSFLGSTEKKPELVGCACWPKRTGPSPIGMLTLLLPQHAPALLTMAPAGALRFEPERVAISGVRLA